MFDRLHDARVRMHLLSRQGIFKSRILDLPISIRSSPDSPYEDFFSEDAREMRPNSWTGLTLRPCGAHPVG